MASKIIPLETHVLGEPQREFSTEAARWPIDTPGGRFYAEWDSQAPVSLEGQIMFFFQFLADCPLHYFGNRGSGNRNVMGIALLILIRLQGDTNRAITRACPEHPATIPRA